MRGYRGYRYSGSFVYRGGYRWLSWGFEIRQIFARYYRKTWHVVSCRIRYEASSTAAASIMFTFGLKSVASKRYR